MSTRSRKILYCVLFVLLAAPDIPLGAQQTGDDIVIGEYVTLHSKILDEERTLLIHLPPDYEESHLRYPVLYHLYGNHVTTYFAEAVAILDDLGETARIPEMILVGITNTDRYRDLLPQKPDGSPTGIDDFLKFFEEEFIPFVENNYRAKNYRLIMGPQAGANFVMYALFEKPELFDACFITSPFRWRGGRDVLVEKSRLFLEENPSFKKFLFITYEDSDPLAAEAIPYLEDFAALAEQSPARDFQVKLNFIEGHDEFLQPLGLRLGLKTLFQEYPFPEAEKPSHLDDILAYYTKLSQKYGFTLDVPDHVLNMQANGWMQAGDYKEAETIFKYMLTQYPASANAFFGMANIKMYHGELEEARDFYQKMIHVLTSDVGMLVTRLQALEKRIQGSAAYAVEKEIRKSGFAVGMKKYQAVRADRGTDLYFDEREFNELGYRLLRNEKMKEAIRIFQLNVDMNPQSANAYDSLAEAYMRDGQMELAVQNYQKSLELDPHNENAEAMLKRLKEKK